jgi:hypothetical protein
MTVYSRERVDAVVLDTFIHSATRILRNTAKHAFDVRATPSRFCDGQSYSVLYGAADFDTSFVEVIVRDRFVGGRARIVPYGEVTTRGWVEFRSSSLLRLIDLRGDGAVKLGSPTDAARARNQSAGRALSRTIHDGHADVDGFVYDSRLTGQSCYAIFERALHKLAEINTGHLEEHARLPAILMVHSVRLIR